MRAAPAAVAALAVAGMACDPQILVGADAVGDGSVAPIDATVDLDASGDGALVPLTVPWSTGFENGLVNGFIDWSQPANQGFCYLMGGGNFTIVSSPVHTGLYAAAFLVNSTNGTISQARCLRQGVLPAAAYYGAWYYVPETAVNTGNWNLLHWQGATGPGALAHGLWDISLVNGPDGSLETSAFDFLHNRALDAGSAIPIGVWFHLEVFLQRSAGDAGAITVTRDGQTVLQLTGLATDDSAWGQWFVGNYANALAPPISTVYVDDVTIGTTPSAP